MKWGVNHYGKQKQPREKIQKDGRKIHWCQRKTTQKGCFYWYSTSFRQQKEYEPSLKEMYSPTLLQEPFGLWVYLGSTFQKLELNAAVQIVRQIIPTQARKKL